MNLQVPALTALASLAACEALDLHPLPDAGVGSDICCVDAGLSDHADDDAGVRDAGSETPPDAGEERCRISGEGVPFERQGTEDFVAVDADAYPDDLQLLALWSHVEDEEVLVDLRFAAMPFDTPRHATVYLAFFGDRDSQQLCADRDGDLCVTTTSQIAIVDNFPAEEGWPPDIVVWRPDELTQTTSSACDSVEVAANREPAIRVRIPRNYAEDQNGNVAYAVMVSATGSCPGDQCQATWFAQRQVLSRGSAAPGDFVSVCDLTCEP